MKLFTKLFHWSSIRSGMGSILDALSPPSIFRDREYQLPEKGQGLAQDMANIGRDMYKVLGDIGRTAQRELEAQFAHNQDAQDEPIASSLR